MPLQATSGAASYDAFGGGVAAVPNYIEDVFSTYLYTGNGSTQTITNGIDLAGKGGLVWEKLRNVTSSNYLIDTARGGNFGLFSNTTGAQFSGVGLTFNSNGYTYASSWGVTQNIASWTFRKQQKFFDMVTYTGNGTTQTINHNLGSTPGFIICKSTTSARNWLVYHRSIGETKFLQLDTTLAATTASTPWNNTAPTSTTFTVGSSLAGNESGQTFVAYLFAHDAGGFGLTGTDNVISCGSFTGAETVNLGWEPQFILYKTVNVANDWKLVDNTRGLVVDNGSGVGDMVLKPNLTNAELGDYVIDPTPTGFKGYESVSNTHIYIAIRRGPMKVPTSGTSVFAPVANTTTQQSPNVVGSLNADWFFARRIDADSNWFQSSKLSPKTMPFNSTGAEQATQYVTFTNTGVKWIDTWSTTATTYRSYLFQRAPSFFDEVCYSGTGTQNAKTHNLTVAPELIIVKKRTAVNGLDGWWVYQKDLPANYVMQLNSSAAKQDTSGYTYPFFSSVGASTFTVGSSDQVNGTPETYVAYLFATCPNVSKVTTFTGNGSSQTINCGFTSGARFVMIKRVDSTGNWVTFDTARGISSGGDPALYLNSTAAEVTGVDAIDTDSTGFIVNQESTFNLNVSSATYLVLAIA